MLHVTNVRVDEDAETKILAGDVAGQTLWFRFPRHIAIVPRGEPFLAALLLRGMRQGEDIHLDESAPISSVVLDRLDQIQKIFRQWNPELKSVAVKATVAPAEVRTSGVLSSFSGGVDSLHSFIEHRNEITHIFLLSGFDHEGPGEEFSQLIAKSQAFCDENGKQLLWVETNVRKIRPHLKVSWEYLHGPLLCTLATAFGFAKFYIASSYTMRFLKPWGSHPVLDPLWSTEATGIVHDGADAFRTEKTINIARHPEMLKHLQVCWKMKTRNCGKCSKCIRTLLVLDMIGVKGAPIPYSDPMADLKLFAPTSDLGASFVWDVMRLAREVGNEPLERAMRGLLRRYLLKRHATGMAKMLFGDPARKLWHGLRKPAWARSDVVMLKDPDNFDL